MPWRVDAPGEAAAVVAGARGASAAGAGMVLAQPVPAADELDAGLHDRLLAEGLALLAERGVTGKDVTPALLEHFHAGSGGASLAHQPRAGAGERGARRAGGGRARARCRVAP